MKNNSIMDEKFSDRIKEIISEVGGAEELSRQSGVTGRAIGSYKLGESDPSRKNLVAIAKAAGVELLWLATGEGPKRKEEKQTPGFMSPPGPTAQESPQGAAPTDFKISEDITLAIQVLESGTHYATALHLNILSFSKSISAESRIEYLENKNKELESRLAALEEKLSREALPPAALAG